MKTTQSSFACSATGQRVWRIRLYEEVGDIGSANSADELVAEQCSHEWHCPHLARCPMRVAVDGR
jgi:hypothetical protein